jgi:oligogalacturonide lyase
MAKGQRYPSESRTSRDEQSGAVVRQLTNHPSVHHHPFFFVPAYDDAMRRLIFVSHRTGSPQIFCEDRGGEGSLVQLTDRPDFNEWSLHPAHDGSAVFFTAGQGGWRLDLATLAETQVADLGTPASGAAGGVGADMGTTALTRDDRWWAVAHRDPEGFALSVVDLQSGRRQVILRRATIGHMQFCPDDPGLLFYAGPIKDRVWVLRRDGSEHRRLYERDDAKREWITHESWVPGTGELAFVNWPHGMWAVHPTTPGKLRKLCSFNAWHPVFNRAGSLVAADTTFPDVGIQLFDPRDPASAPRPLCYPQSSNAGEHWGKPFPYEQGMVKVYAPQHTHPHPSFSPDGRLIVFTSDRTGFAQLYECEL